MGVNRNTWIKVGYDVMISYQMNTQNGVNFHDSQLWVVICVSFSQYQFDLEP